MGLPVVIDMRLDFSSPTRIPCTTHLESRGYKIVQSHQTIICTHAVRRRGITVHSTWRQGHQMGWHLADFDLNLKVLESTTPGPVFRWL